MECESHLRSSGYALAGALALALTGCGGGSGGSMIVTPTTGTLKVSLTDGPACGFSAVEVTVGKVRVNASSSASANASGWTDLAVDPSTGPIDLLTLTDGATFPLTEGDLPSGTYAQIRLVLTAASVTTADGLTQPINLSAAQDGFLASGSATVPADGTAEVALDFDACRSVVADSNGGFALQPVLTAIPLDSAARITGTATGAAGARVYAERNGGVVKSTVADANGNFTLWPVTQTAQNGDTVDVVVVPVADSTGSGRVAGVITNVPVQRTTPTDLGTLDLPVTNLYRRVSGTMAQAAPGASVRVLQTIGGNKYEIAYTNVAPDSGSYSFYAYAPALTAPPPYFAVYGNALGPSLNGGIFEVEATRASGQVVTNTADVRLGDRTVDF